MQYLGFYKIGFTNFGNNKIGGSFNFIPIELEPCFIDAKICLANIAIP
jgi:hypothetical protein